MPRRPHPAPVALAYASACWLALAGCQPAPPQEATTQAALEPFAEDQVEPVVKVDPEALLAFAIGDNGHVDEAGGWVDGDAANLTSILVFDNDPLPATLEPLDLPTVQAVLGGGAAVRRVDLRIAHAPDRWPEGAQVPGDAGVLRSTLLNDVLRAAPPGFLGIDSPPHTQLFKPGGTVDYGAGEGTPPRTLLEYLANHPALFAYALEVNTQSQPQALQEPWVHLKIRVQGNGLPPSRTLVPRRDWEAPLARTADALLANPAAVDPTQVQPGRPVQPSEAGRHVDESAEGTPLMQVVDPNAVLYTFTLPHPTVASDELLAFARFLAEEYLKAPQKSVRE
ncbi:MAG TPA: hypothetical protein VEI97_01205 [bacterium]|nr:hypothetical protein [bacterium]